MITLIVLGIVYLILDAVYPQRAVALTIAFAIGAII